MSQLISSLENADFLTKNYGKKSADLIRVLIYISKKRRSLSISVSSRFLSSLHYKYAKLLDALIQKNYLSRGTSYCNYVGKKSYCKSLTLSDTFSYGSLDESQEGRIIADMVSKKVGKNEHHLPFSKAEIDVIKSDLARFSTVDLKTKEKKNIDSSKIIQGYYENRIYTNITSISDKKYQLLIDGEETAELDISNSFPSIIGQKMLNEGYRSDDVVVYCNITQSGIFYEHLSSATNMERKVVKKMFQVYLNCPLDIQDKLLMSDVMRDRFPQVHDYICKLKVCYGVSRKTNPNNQIFFDVISQFESKIICKKLSSRLREELSLCLATKHDSIIFKKIRLEEVLPIWEDVLREVFTFHNQKKLAQ